MYLFIIISLQTKYSSCDKIPLMKCNCPSSTSESIRFELQVYVGFLKLIDFENG
jgi:hypothetical protein